MTSNIITLDVGGTVFKTSKSTLMASGFFDAMLNGPWAETSNEDDPIFIDRDPENFRHILAILRDPQHVIPHDITYELDYFQMDWAKPKKKSSSLVENLIDGEHKPMTREVFDRIFECQKNSNSGINCGHFISTQAVGNLDINRRKEIHSHGFIFPIQPEPSMSCYLRQPILPRYPVTGINNRFKFTIPRQGDTVVDMVLRFQMEATEWQDDHDPRYDVISQIDLTLGGLRIDTLSGQALQLLDVVHMPSDKRRARQNIERHSCIVTMRIPFFFSGAKHINRQKSILNQSVSSALPVVAIPYREIMITIDFKIGVTIIDPVLDIEYSLLDRHEREQLCRHKYDIMVWQHQTERQDLQQHLRVFKLHFRYQNPAHEFYWAVQGTETGSFYVIEQTEMRVNQYNMFTSTDRVIRERIILNPDCQGNGMLPIYYWSMADGSLDGSRIHELTFYIQLLDNLPEPAEFIVMVKTRNYARVHNGDFLLFNT